MSMFGRLRRGVDTEGTSGAIANGGGGRDLRGAVDVETFEYVRVGSTALARVAGRWSGDRSGSPDFTLVVDDEESRHEIRALAETVPADSDGVADSSSWRAAFPMTIEIVEQPSAGFTLRTSEGAVALPKPILRALYVQDADTASKRTDYRPEEVEDLEAR